MPPPQPPATAGQLLLSMDQPAAPPPPPVDTLTQNDTRAIYRTPETPAPPAAGDRARALLEAPGAIDVIRALGQTEDHQAVAAGAVLARVAQQVAMADPHDTDTDGQRGATWNLAAADHAMAAGAMADPRFTQLYKAFVANPRSLSPEDADELAKKLASYGDMNRNFDSPDNPSTQLELANVTFMGDQAAVALTPKPDAPIGDLVAQATMPVIPAAATSAPLAFVRTGNGTAVVGRKDNSADVTLRVMYPALPIGAGWQWAPRKAVDVASVEQLSSRVWGTGDLPAAELEVLYGLTGPPPAATPGNHIIVRVPSRRAEPDLRAYLAQAAGAEATDLPSSEIQRPKGGDVTANPARALTVKLPNDATPTDVRRIMNGLVALGGAAPIAYLHRADQTGLNPVREHHYIGPAGQTIIVRSSAGDIDAPHSYAAWMRPQDSAHLTGPALDVNRASPPATGQDPVRQADGSYLLDGELRLHFEHNLNPEVKRARLSSKVWDSTVAGARAKHFVLDTPPADMPNLSIGTDEASAKKGLPGTTAAISGVTRPDGSLQVLVAPVIGDFLDLNAVAVALATLRRVGVSYDPKRTTLGGTDGRRYQPNGEPR